jgi:PAS domain S-box-containing protein
MRILVVDDHEVVRRGICSVLATDPELTICGEAMDGQDALEKAIDTRPDVVVMDISMPRMNGLEAARQIKRHVPETEIVIISQHDIPEMVRQAFHAGARAFVPKSTISRDLLRAISKAIRREPFVGVAGPGDINPNLDPQEILQRSSAFEKALGESDERFHSAMSNMAEGLYTIDTQGLATYINPSAEMMFGWSPDELLGRKMHEVTHYKYPDGTPFPAADCAGLQVLQKGIPVREHEDAFIRKDGTFFPVIFSASPLKNGGKITGLVVGFHDITKRREIEAALNLRAAIVDSSDDAIVSKNLDGIINTWNKGAEQMFGYSAEEAIGKHITLIIPADRRDEETTILENLRRGKRIDHFETVRVRKDGKRIEISLTISPIKDSMGRIVGASKVARDITGRKHIERALREREERLRALAGALETQVKDRTQELEKRNSEILQQSEQLRELSNRLLQTQDEERRRIARELHDGVGQLLAALNMNLSTLINEKSRLSPDACRSLDENAALIEQASQEIRTMSHLLHPPLLDEVGLESALSWYIDGFSERSKITVRMQLAPRFSEGLPRDLALGLFRIVQECLTNVHRHSGSPTALVAIDRSSDEIMLQIKDDGRGIPAEIQSKILSGESSGVGLRGIRERVRQFGGRIEVRSDHKGTQILAVLPTPALQLAGQKIGSEASDGNRQSLERALEDTGHDEATILCIDDESAGLLPRKLLLESAGHRVIEARSGEDGIQLFKSEKVDAVILDYWMSEMKGTAVALELKRINPAIPIIVLSGLSELPGEASGLVDEWLVKGSHRAEKLLDSIGALLERRPD